MTSERKDERFIVKRPCAECPFSRRVVPGTLGGSPPEVYIGQAHGPFFLPCHSHTNYSDPNWRTDISKPQCAGAAMFRNLTDDDSRWPDAFHHLSGDPTLVFTSDAELLAHHKQIPLEEAERRLDGKLESLVLAEMERARWRKPL